MLTFVKDLFHRPSPEAKLLVKHLPLKATVGTGHVFLFFWFVSLRCSYIWRIYILNRGRLWRWKNIFKIRRWLLFLICSVVLSRRLLLIWFSLLLNIRSWLIRNQSHRLLFLLYLLWLLVRNENTSSWIINFLWWLDFFFRDSDRSILDKYGILLYSAVDEVWLVWKALARRRLLLLYCSSVINWLRLFMRDCYFVKLALVENTDVHVYCRRIHC